MKGWLPDFQEELQPEDLILYFGPFRSVSHTFSDFSQAELTNYECCLVFGDHEELAQGEKFSVDEDWRGKHAAGIKF